MYFNYIKYMTVWQSLVKMQDTPQVWSVHLYSKELWLFMILSPIFSMLRSKCQYIVFFTLSAVSFDENWDVGFTVNESHLHFCSICLCSISFKLYGNISKLLPSLSAPKFFFGLLFRTIMLSWHSKIMPFLETIFNFNFY